MFNVLSSHFKTEENRISSFFEKPFSKDFFAFEYSASAPSIFKAMINFSRKKSVQYLYLMPKADNLARWEVIDQEELDLRVEENRLSEGSRLFKIDHEVNIRFEKITHLE